MNCILSVLIIANVAAQGRVDTYPRLVPANQHTIVQAKNSFIRLSPTEVRLRMLNLPNWTTDGNTLFYTRTFEDFVEAINFINSLVEPAEQLNHHPDIRIQYNRVFLELTTHDAQGLTDLDFQLAQKISQLQVSPQSFN
ncbi:pterin-4-alpha-carbinolamine dehydratase [Leptolyngbya sp. Heron Island J]|uniref:4a-hydroxytetrahydrobiopterin dehydratase n=1 Tax=Leptolyngbya sp. Heron Island J TaxID=1385935 RepID=UPI0003B98433|nr:pterin-4-alpha-carbinolamine dehydratase [Leptolyngbya sp. Heron Island J]